MDRKMILLLLCLWTGTCSHPAAAFAQTPDALSVERTASAAQTPLAKFEKAAALTKVPWFYIAAVYQYETSLQPRKKKAEQESVFQIKPDVWSGTLNPNQDDRYEGTIRVYQGIGRDGNKDGIADPANPDDILYAIGTMLASNGYTEDDIRTAIWNHYRNSIMVERISGFARIYNQYKTTALQGTSFPIDKRYSYSYRSTWGYSRSWGGRRSHEGTDIFADYGTPVLSSSYGIVELKGWNEYGGWRIGIRDLNNVYHYYAHLSRYEKGLQMGSIVTPGQRIGYVGSSGYGKPGTSGKFAPHLHYGMYRDTGTREYAFDPTPYLYRWERLSRASK